MEMDYSGLIISMVNLSNALTKRNPDLAKHGAMMENLTLAVKQLEAALKKASGQDTAKPSLKLKQALAAFVEYHINPQYYDVTGYSMLAGGAPGIKLARLAAGQRNRLIN
jgi:hypothetical protein